MLLADPAVADWLAHTLGGAFEVRSASSADAAMEDLQAIAPRVCCVVIGQTVEDKSVRRVLALARAIRPHVPAIVVTAAGVHAKAALAAAYGATTISAPLAQRSLGTIASAAMVHQAIADPGLARAAYARSGQAGLLPLETEALLDALLDRFRDCASKAIEESRARALRHNLLRKCGAGKLNDLCAAIFREALSVSRSARGGAPILIVDDAPVVLRALTRVLGTWCDASCATSLGDAVDRLTIAGTGRVTRFAGFLFDMRLSDGLGTTLVPLARQNAPRAPIRILSGVGLSEIVDDAGSLGVPFLSKPAALADLTSFVASSLLVHAFEDDRLCSALQARCQEGQLDPHETQVLVSLVQGLSDAEMIEAGAHLPHGLRMHKIRSHKEAIRTKLHANSISELLLRLFREALGLIPSEAA